MLTGRTALVTGGARGIGKAIVERLASDGARVAFTYLQNKDKAEVLVEAINSLGGRAKAIRADAGQPREVQRAFDETEASFGPIDIMIANAGSFFSKPLSEMSAEDFDRGMSINSRGTFLAFSEAARRITNGGKIVGFSTNLTRMPRPGIAIYTAGKAVVEQLVKGLSRELGPREINVNAVAPGPTETEMLSETGRKSAPTMAALGRIADPAEIASVVAFLVSDEAKWITGQIIDVNGGMT
jgi:3-oxoacyl-[acyl-carrier protein] reductase